MDTPLKAPRGDDNAVVLLDVYANFKWVVGGHSWLRSIWPAVKSIAGWQIAQAVRFGVMGGLTNTYDEAPHMGDVNSWNAFLHLAAVEASRRLAVAAGDTAFATELAGALHTARNATIKHLWLPKLQRFRGYWCNCSATAYQRNTNNLMADSLYGVLWAKVLGLDLGIDDRYFSDHQRHSWNADAASNTSTPWGLNFWIDKSRDYSCMPLPGGQQNDQFTDDTIWSAHSVDEGALALLLGVVPAADALAMAARTYTMYRTTLRDQWDFRDVGAVRHDGPIGTTGVRPFCNSHYTRHLFGLHALPLALTGQHYDAGTGALKFMPVRSVLRGRSTSDHTSNMLGAEWPFFTPQGSGIVRELRDGPGGSLCISLQLLSGTELALRVLEVEGTRYEAPSNARSTSTGLVAPAVVVLNSTSRVAVMCALDDSASRISVTV